MTRKLAWTGLEDRRLTGIIESRKIYTKGDGKCTINASWGEIAELMPSRSAKQCRERWCYNLNPAIKRDIWSAKEDAILVKAQSILGNQWALIARHLPGRTENSVKTRHKSIMRAKKRAWSEEEDEVILSMHRQIGSRWEKIAERFPNRTSNGVKTRFGLLRRGLAHEKPLKGSPEQILNKPELVEKVELNLPDRQRGGRRPKRRRNFFNIPAAEETDEVKVAVSSLIGDMLSGICGDEQEEVPLKRPRCKEQAVEVTATQPTVPTLSSPLASLPLGDAAGTSLLNSTVLTPPVNYQALMNSYSAMMGMQQLQHQHQMMMYSQALGQLALQQSLTMNQFPGFDPRVPVPNPTLSMPTPSYQQLLLQQLSQTNHKNNN